MTPRPLLTPPRDRYVYFPDQADVPEPQPDNIANVRTRSGARRHPPSGAEGATSPTQSRFGAQALYARTTGSTTSTTSSGALQKVVADEDLPTGENLILSASFDKQSEDPPGVANGTLSLYHGETKVGEAQIKTQPGKFVIGGEGLCVGRDSGAGVTDDYPGTMPWRFTGGTIHRVAVDVSGQPYVDLEREAVAMLMRE